jgi:hypothetical protein
MPLDFNTTKDFRDRLLRKTLQVPNGPQTFTQNNYSIVGTNEFSNVDPGAVDTDRARDLSKPQQTNVYKPLKYNVIEEFKLIPRRANLSLYYNGTPYFVSRNHSLVGIMSNQNYDNESELFKFAASYIQDKNQKGPVYARIQQNLYKETFGKVRLLDALNGNLATATNIITGKEPLVESNYQITVAKTPIGKGIDFLQNVAGVEFPWVEIPGDYLSNPRNPVNARPVPNSEFGKIFQDVTGALGSLIGIERRPKKSRKPSDLFIEYMGSGQKQMLYDLLSYSKYAPNYTTTARSQNSSNLFNFADRFAQGSKTLLGLEAPNSNAYIGDDRGNDVKFAMSDFNDRPVRSPFYLSLLFDPIQTELFERKKNIGESGQISGKLTWISINTKNKFGANNKQFNSQRSKFEDSLSTKFDFRDDSILGITQDILDSMPTNGGEARSHVANVIDQTTRIFREGRVNISRGSAIKYVDKFGQDSGVEYCRVWTKDRPYITNSDTMKKGNNIRKFDGSIISDPWNLNIAPMSNGKKGFDGSSNIFGNYKYGPDADGKNFYAKKYMFSIENLAWRTSDKPGFTVLDLPFCERGPNGGRIMWFPPYDLKVSENNAASWESNRFLGRPEPIYTYSNTERTGQISFKIVVDHPSILNLLVRDLFSNMSDEESDNYINAVFAGCKDLDFYDLIRRYTTLDKSDIQNIISYLNQNGTPEEVQTYITQIDRIEVPAPATTTTTSTTPNTKSLSGITLNFDNDIPKRSNIETQTASDYTTEYNSYITKKTNYADILSNQITSLNSKPLNDPKSKGDREKLFGSNIIGDVSEKVSQLNGYFDELTNSYNKYSGATTELKTNISEKKVQNIVVNLNSSTSSSSNIQYNLLLSLRRNYSVLLDFLRKISKDGKEPSTIKWPSASEAGQSGAYEGSLEISLKDLGWAEMDGKITIKNNAFGEYGGNNDKSECFNKDFDNKQLDITAPISFYCRKSEIDFNYELLDTPKPPPNVTGTTSTIQTKLLPGEKIKIPPKSKKPPIDVMKRIIMKTLSECFYFKKLEEDSPLVFNSLKEKLKYFHPAFHSTTPEGLNSRLTFLHQCLRPGDTIPKKGVVDTTDIDARNTTFGPPPICVLRIGDFYHSKIVIRDINMSYDDSTWDMNPEGIGYQPMIANITMSINFIGGQGLEETVDRLQNALSSNFYANTEIYDERAISTNKLINGKEANEFTKKFLESLQRRGNDTPKPTPETPPNKIQQGRYIGDTFVTGILNYDYYINDTFLNTKNYFIEYENLYKIIFPNYGAKITSIALSPEYRTINTYEITKGDNTTTNINLFGLYKKGFELDVLSQNVKNSLNDKIESENICQIFGFDKELPQQTIEKANRYLKPKIKFIVTTKLDNLSSLEAIKSFEKKRNNTIKTLDRLNFIVKHERDFKIEKDKNYEVELSGFTRNLLYNEYSYCIEYFETKTSTMYTDLDTTINFINPTLTTQDVSEMLSVLLQKDVDSVLESLKVDTALFNETTIKRLKNKLDSFVSTPKVKTFKFDKFKDRATSIQTGKKIEYKIQSETETTNQSMIEDGEKINSSVVVVKDKLNFYKISS